MIEWWNTGFGEAEASAVSKVVSSGYLNEGAKTKEFEKSVAELLEVKHVHAVPNGTVALAVALWALDVKPGDHVIIPNITFIATASAVRMVGAIPVLCDVNLNDMNICIEQIRLKITEKVKAIIIVHINGRCCNVAEIEKIKTEFGLPVIEDTAQGLGSKNKKPLGTFFDVGTISLAPSKVISTGQGGLVLTNNLNLSEKIIRLKDHGRLSRSDLNHPIFGFNFKFTDLQAAVGLEQLQVLDSRLQKAIDDYDYYRKVFSQIEGIDIYSFDFANGEVPLWIDFRSPHRIKLFSYLEGKNIFPRPIWECLHRSWIGGKDQDFPNSCKIASEAFWLPSGPTLAEKNREIVANEVLNFYKSL